MLSLNRATEGRSSSAAIAAVLALSLLQPVPAAHGAVHDGLLPDSAPVTTTWWRLRSEAAMQADRDYVAGMRPHHAGALTMSADYLRDPGRSSPLLQALSRAIVANQRFEIAVLDEVQRNLDAPPLRLPLGATLQPVATEGLERRQRFFRAPIPSGLTDVVGSVSEADVRFAKAMIIHHEAAVDMARGYLRDPAARNGFLGQMNVGIVTDQTQEIALMRRVIAAFPGDPDRVEVPPGMVHGMEGMRHGGTRGAADASPHGGASAMETPEPAGHGHHAGHAGGHPARQDAQAPAPRAPAARPPHGVHQARHRQERHGHGGHHHGHDHAGHGGNHHGHDHHGRRDGAARHPHHGH